MGYLFFSFHLAKYFLSQARDEMDAVMQEKNWKTEEDFFQSFSAFADDKSAEDIISEIKESRNFVEKINII